MKNLKYTWMLLGMGCLGLQASAQVYVNHTVNQAPQLVATAGPTAVFCAGDSLTLGGNPTAGGGTGPFTYSWQPSTDLNDATAANPLATPTGSTVYSVQVTDANGCTSTDNVSLTLQSSTAAYTFLANLLSYQFTDGSTNANTWLWDFGDGSTSTLQNPSHQFPTAGTYVVCLTINGGTGCQQTICDTLNAISIGVAPTLPGVSVQVYPNPSANGQLNFEVAGRALEGEVRIKLLDLQGRLVREQAGSAATQVHTMLTKQLAAGTYQYQVLVGEQLAGTGKVVLR